MKVFDNIINTLFVLMIIFTIATLVVFIIFLTKKEWTNSIIWGIALAASLFVAGFLYKAEKVTLFSKSDSKAFIRN